ncbi:MAG: hypothetical protein WKF94_18730 [Solirubrobacteraceae bacterium]
MAPKNDPDETVHLQVKVGHTALYQGKAFGDRGTIQAPRRDAELLIKAGDVEYVKADEVPEVSTRPAA